MTLTVKQLNEGDAGMNIYVNGDGAQITVYNIAQDLATVTEIEKQISKECLGFLSLLKYSSLPARKIKEIWGHSDLRYR